jgi:transcriptional regulator with XRE-family HTH domain
VEPLLKHRSATLSKLISSNIRFALWRKSVPRGEWVKWLTQRTGLYADRIRSVLKEQVSDDEIGADEWTRLATAIDMADESELLRFSNLAGDGCNVLRENLSYLLDTLEYGGKKLLAESIHVDPTTVSRWLKGTSQPTEATLRQISTHFGLPSKTDLRIYPVFLSFEPIAVTERKDWVNSQVTALTAEDFQALYPALRRMLDR